MIEEVIVEEDEDDLDDDDDDVITGGHGLSPNLLRRSKSTPLTKDDDRSVMTFATSAASVATADTSLASGLDTVGVLVDVEDPMPSFEPLNLEDRIKQVRDSRF